MLARDNSVSPDEHTLPNFPPFPQEQVMAVGTPSDGGPERRDDPELPTVRNASVPSYLPPIAQWIEVLRMRLIASILVLCVRLTSFLTLSGQPMQIDSPLPQDATGGAEHVEQEMIVPPEVINSCDSTYDTTEQTHGPRDVYSTVHNLPEHLAPPRVAMNSIVITRIQATGVIACLRRTPVGFYIAVQFNGLEWRTSTKAVMVDDDTVEWDDAIVLPSEQSASVRLEIRASYELVTMLGSGEELNAMNITVGELLNRSNRGLPITFFPKDGELSSSSSLAVTVERWERGTTGLEATLAYRPADSERFRKLEEATDLGHSALSRYRKHGRKQDLEQSLLQSQRALNLCPPEHPCRASTLFNVATAKLIGYRANGSCFDLDDSISLYRDALDLRPIGHLDRPATLLQLAIALFVLSEKQCCAANAVEGEELLLQVLELASTESYEHRIALLMLETQRVYSIIRHEGLGVGEQPGWADFIQRFADDERADLGVQLVHQFQHHGDVANLQLATSLLEARQRYVSRGDRRYPRIMCNLGAALLHRFRRLGELADLDQAISRFEDAVRFAPHDHPYRVTCLSNLGVCFRTRFDRLGDLGDLDRAIAKQKDVAQVTPDDHPDRAGRMNSLGVSSSTRFDRLGDLSDLDHAITTFEETLRLTPHDHTDRASRLNNLGVLHNTRFQRLGNLDELDRAIAMHENAMRLTPADHPDRPGRLNNMGIAFKTRFDRLGGLQDLDQAITWQGEALRLTPCDHPDRPGRLNNLAVSFKTRFDRLGEIVDLDQATAMQEDALRLIPNDHPDRAGHLDNLGISCRTRFQRLRELHDLDRAITVQQESVQLTPDGHPDRISRLNNLGITLRTGFDHLGHMHDLDRAISIQQDVVQATPDGYPDHAGRLNNLAVLYNTRFQKLGDLADLEHAILMQEHAVRLTPDGHPDRPGRLNNVGINLKARFERFGELQDINRAIACHEDAVSLTPPDHPARVSYLLNLGISFLARSDSLADMSDMENALSKLSVAARSTSGSSSIQFSAARKWIASARSLGHGSLLDAYSVALDIIPRLAWIGLPIQDRYHVTREAASAALEHGQAERAVEWLEKGRSVVWNELLQLRAPLAELRAVHPALADQLLEVSRALEHISARDPSTSLEDQARRHRALASERERLLGIARSLPGFERLLLGMSFTQLTAAAHAGPVVYLNASTRGCDAVMILAHVDSVLHVQLPDVTIAQAEAMVNVLDNLVSVGRGMNGVEQAASRPDFADAKAFLNLADEESKLSPNDCFQEILSFLWIKVVRPVLDALGFSTPGELSRIFWCPTGPFVFLPIHAAGLYGTEEPGSKLSDFTISSYTPTLSALIPKPTLNTNHPALNGGHVRLLAVRQPDTDGQIQLPGASKEIENIKALARLSPHVTVIESKAAVDDVLDNMKDSDWVHFACHGLQDLASPVDSGLMLADQRRLKLSDIIKLSRPSGGLAFLSACQTATGDGLLSEEAVHLAAGMLFAGYSSVIATNWAILDDDAPLVAQYVYEQLFGDSEMPDSKRSAEALHYAVQQLRERGVSFASWVQFVHIGV